MPADLTLDIIYRGFVVNDEDIALNIVQGSGIGDGIAGSVVDSFDDSDVDVVQFAEKRSQQDGMDAGVPLLGMRRIRMSATLYGRTRALLYDSLMDLRAAFSPVLAYREEPLDYGYQPLYFSIPTNRIADYPAGAIPLMVKAMPRALSTPISRDMTGGDDNDSLAISWQATLICKDPSIMGATPQDYDIDRAPGASTGNTVNRGHYICPVNMLIVVGTPAGSIACTIGDSVFTITVPASTGNRTIRFKGEDKVLTVEEDSVEVTRMDLLAFSGDTTWPFISTGTTAYSVTYTSVTAASGSHMWFYERYA